MQPDNRSTAEPVPTEPVPPEPVPAEAPVGESTPSGKSTGVPAPAETSSAASRWRERLGPLWAQTWRNLRIWFPGLANPGFRDREVIYAARESRKVSEWQVALPERCWVCDRTDDLSQSEIHGAVRSFEYALNIVSGGLTGSLVVGLFSLWIGSWFMTFVALVGVFATVAVLWLKSWPEWVRVVIWSCSEHEEPEPELEAVVDDAELHLLLPNRRIAAHARESLKQSRRGRDAYDTDAGHGAVVQPRPSSVEDELSALPLSSDAPGSERYVSPHGATGPSVPDLPPIEIDDGPLVANEDQGNNDPGNGDTPAPKPAADAGSADPTGSAS